MSRLPALAPPGLEARTNCTPNVRSLDFFWDDDRADASVSVAASRLIGARDESQVHYATTKAGKERQTTEEECSA